MSGALDGAPVLVLYLIGILGLLPQQPIGTAAIKPWYLMGLDPLIWGIILSATSGILISLMTKPLDEELVKKILIGSNPSQHNQSAALWEASARQHE